LIEQGDPREELAELASAVRAYAEWQAETGADGLPVEGSASGLLAELASTRGPASRSGPALRPPPGQDAGYAHAVRVERPSTPAAREGVAVSPAAPVTQAPVATAAAVASTDERRNRLALLAEEVRSCTRCVLHRERKQTVFSRGDPFSELAFIGEGPGADEDATGLPFVGPAGQLLDRMIAAMGYRRDDVYVCNVVKCRPPNNRKPEPDEMASCMPFLLQQVALGKPRVIVALGATAVQGLCGTTEGITRLRGKWKLLKGATPVMPTFHPAYLLRNPAAKREVWLDLQEVLKHLGKSLPGKT
jgi:uracil-DNA glycosylase